MAQSTVVTLLPQTPHPGPQGSSQSITGEKQQAASYILAASDLQTITWHLQYNLANPNPPNNNDTSPANNFVGTIHIQASLVDNPQDGHGNTPSDWFKVFEVPTSGPDQYNGYFNLLGNYVWLRARVTNWTAGAIYLITASY
jgi:hypothetical protein